MKPSCPICGHIHTSTDARMLGRFGGAQSFVAATAGTPPRATRAEAEADECAGRVRRRATATPTPIPAPAPAVETQPELPVPGEPFPAARMEQLAREKSWLDFLVQVNFSLLVWEVDPEVRAGCESPVTWLRRCFTEVAL